MVEHGADLLESDTRKPIHELRRDRTIFEILEERRYRHARAAKHPDTAHAVGIPFNGRARGLTNQANRRRADGAQRRRRGVRVE